MLRWWMLGAATAVCIFSVSVWLAGVSAPVAADTAQGNVSVPAPTQTVVSPYRRIGVWEGKLAVFLPEIHTPERVYEIWLDTLPEEEQARLFSGILVANRAELMAYLEDYTG